MFSVAHMFAATTSIIWHDFCKRIHSHYIKYNGGNLNVFILLTVTKPNKYLLREFFVCFRVHAAEA